MLVFNIQKSKKSLCYQLQKNLLLLKIKKLKKDLSRFLRCFRNQKFSELTVCIKKI